MTSSLVGSEMCIRDSSMQDQWTSGKWGSPGVRCDMQDHCTSACWGSCVAVSYTHLTLPTICSV
eukprot:4681631-Prorocentrum_lima.AAC.1